MVEHTKRYQYILPLDMVRSLHEAVAKVNSDCWDGAPRRSCLIQYSRSWPLDTSVGEGMRRCGVVVLTNFDDRFEVHEPLNFTEFFERLSPYEATDLEWPVLLFEK